MARRKRAPSRSRVTTRRPQRDRRRIAKRAPLRLRAAPLRSPNALADRRLYHPNPFLRPAPSTWRAATRLVVATTPMRRGDRSEVRLRRGVLEPNVQFAVPKRVIVCIRRKQRREVLHAMKRTGSGKGRRRRRNEWSSVIC